MTAANPLLQDFDLPPYSQIKPEHVEPAVEQILADSRVAIAELLKTQQASPSWDGLVLALDELIARLGRAWGPVSHLNAVCNNAELRAAYEACLPKLSEYWTEMGQNKPLFEAYDALAKSPAAEGFDVAQKTILDHRTVHHDAAHADQNAVAQGAAVQGDVVADGHFVADQQRVAVGVKGPGVGDMQHAAVLHAAALADPDPVHVSAHHGHRPHRGILAQHHVAEYHGRGVDEGARAQLWSGTPVSSNRHDSLLQAAVVADCN